jgi:hypothetical protein
LHSRCAASQSLKEVLAAQIPGKQAAWKAMKQNHGNKIIDHVTLDQCMGGARSVKCMVWETSLLDAEEVRAQPDVDATRALRAGAHAGPVSGRAALVRSGR